MAIILKQKIEVLIVSYGGVGTTFLADSISKFKTTNSPENLDGYKHLPIPPIILNKNTKIIFVYGDPILATISLFKRKFHSWQSVLLQRYYQKKVLISKNCTIEEYAQLEEDGFQFERQFLNWYSKYLVNPTLFIKYDAIFENLDVISSFLSLPEEFIDSFPAKRQRTSKIDNLDYETLDKLEEKYGEFQRYLKEYKACEIRSNESITRRLSIYFSPIYLKGIFLDLSIVVKRKLKVIASRIKILSN